MNVPNGCKSEALVKVAESRYVFALTTVDKTVTKVTSDAEICARAQTTSHSPKPKANEMHKTHFNSDFI